MLDVEIVGLRDVQIREIKIDDLSFVRSFVLRVVEGREVSII